MGDNKKLQTAFDAVRFMEEHLPEELTAQHEVYFDPDVSDQGTPYVSVTVSGDKGVEALTGLFGDNIEYQRAGDDSVIIPVVIKPLEPKSGMN